MNSIRNWKNPFSFFLSSDINNLPVKGYSGVHLRFPCLMALCSSVRSMKIIFIYSIERDALNKIKLRVILVVLNNSIGCILFHASSFNHSKLQGHFSQNGSITSSIIALVTLRKHPITIMRGIHRLGIG